MTINLTEAGSVVATYSNALSVTQGEATFQIGATAGQTVNVAIRRVVPTQLGIAKENLAASESQIRDTDLAAEMAEFTRSQIPMQAGTAMLAQANMAPQVIPWLLQ